MGAHLHSAWHGGQPTTKGNHPRTWRRGSGVLQRLIKDNTLCEAQQQGNGRGSGAQRGTSESDSASSGKASCKQPPERRGRNRTWKDSYWAWCLEQGEAPFLSPPSLLFLHSSSPHFHTTSTESPPCLRAKLLQLCSTPCDPMDSSVHGILQPRILEWVAVSSKGTLIPALPVPRVSLGLWGISSAPPLVLPSGLALTSLLRLGAGLDLSIHQGEAAGSHNWPVCPFLSYPRIRNSNHDNEALTQYLKHHQEFPSGLKAKTLYSQCTSFSSIFHFIAFLFFDREGKHSIFSIQLKSHL